MKTKRKPDSRRFVDFKGEVVVEKAPPPPPKPKQ